MANANVYLGANVQEFTDVVFTDVVNGTNIVPVVWKAFTVRFAIIGIFEDARQTCNTERSVTNDVRGPQVIDIWSQPTAVVQLKEIVRSFMIAADNQCQNRCPF